MGDWTRYVNLPKAIEKVSAAEVQRVAAKYFVSRRSTTGWFVPKNGVVALRQSSAPYGPNYLKQPDDETDPAKGEKVSNPTTAAEPKDSGFAQNMQSTRIGKIELTAIKMPIEGVVSFVGSFAAGSSFSRRRRQLWPI